VSETLLPRCMVFGRLSHHLSSFTVSVMSLSRRVYITCVEGPGWTLQTFPDLTFAGYEEWAIDMMVRRTYRTMVCDRWTVFHLLRLMHKMRSATPAVREIADRAAANFRRTQALMADPDLYSQLTKLSRRACA
jgi:hypothetical protein